MPTCQLKSQYHPISTSQGIAYELGFNLGPLLTPSEVDDAFRLLVRAHAGQNLVHIHLALKPETVSGENPHQKPEPTSKPQVLQPLKRPQLNHPHKPQLTQQTRSLEFRV